MPEARLNGIDIHYQVRGEGTPLVLAHGYTASMAMWRAQVPAFSSRYRLVTYDLRGHGRTTAPADMRQYDLARDYVGDQLALMNYLGIERAYIGGLSMGGMIAQEFVLQHPERTSAALFFDTGPGGGPQFADPVTRMAFEQMRDAMRFMARTSGMNAVVDAMRARMATMRPEAAAGLPAGVRDFMAGLREMSVDGYLGGAEALRGWRGSLERLGRIRVPTLVLAGEHDNLLGPSRIIHERIPRSRFVMLRNSGHGTAVWRPRTFARVTMAFLADVEAKRAVAGELVA